MKRISADEIQPLLLDILVAFSRYCEQRGLGFFLCSGTLLGAVRHNGFIPWDDDIDVGMLWPHYAKLLDAAQTDPYIDDAKRYRIYQPLELPNIYPFVKIVDERTVAYERNINRKYAIGLWLDVFCFAGYPESEQDTKRYYDELMRLRKLNQIMVCGDIKDAHFKRLYPIAQIAKVGMKLTGKNEQYFARKMLVMERTNLDDPQYVGDICWQPGPHKRFPVECFTETRPFDFEGCQMPGPVGYDRYLTQIYGDYLQLPPEDQRVRHAFEAYYRQS